VKSQKKSLASISWQLAYCSGGERHSIDGLPGVFTCAVQTGNAFTFIFSLHYLQHQTSLRIACIQHTSITPKQVFLTTHSHYPSSQEDLDTKIT
jgi:hypothetical protein